MGPDSETSVILCEKFYWRAPNKTIHVYGHKKKVCPESDISIGLIYASFHNFHNVSIYVKWPQKLVMISSIRVWTVDSVNKFKQTYCLIERNTLRYLTVLWMSFFIKQSNKSKSFINTCRTFKSK